ncbi:MAG: DUF4390 domain-containing protein [Thiobacillus sp.]
MMVSSTPCCARFERALRWIAAALFACCVGLASADGRSAVKEAAIHATAQGHVLDADIKVALNRTLEDALVRGIDLHFLLELEVTRPRDWWFDADVVAAVRTQRLYYHLLLRRYIVDAGYRTQTAATLDEALALLGRVDGWRVAERGMLEPGRRYEGRLRLRLDSARLPKPLSIGAVAGDRWEFATPWYAWSFDAPSPPPPASSQALP